ncbi:D-inositol-3-phosphate glycosyltransferase [Pseudomonas fluorescens]|uniref:glycosyltransferase n=1 Tax=Pseudomonas fluorescens TaxID=294 RepID=UPI00123F82DD|nr:glycosyltransferase [Pseudomonas fluorescens]VVM48004.1 D-inositol-3-phosphate glycosyltransferase [Pseudomonas fluorescens]
MNVLLVNISLDAQRGGGTAERTRHLANTLADKGCCCKVIAMSGDSWKSEFNSRGVKTYITGKVGQRFPIPLVNFIRLWKTVKSADIIHIMGYWNLLSVITGFFARIARTPYVLCPAGEFASIGKPRKIMKLFHLLLGKSLINRASGFIAITQLERVLIADVTGFLPDRIPVFPNGVTEPALSPTRTLQYLPEEPYILFMGRLAPVKGPDLLIKAYLSTKVAHHYPLVVAGPDFGMQAELEASLIGHEVSRQVSFIGFLNEAQRNEAYQHALMLVIPSRSEAMSLVALEAGITGLPVLLTSTCGFDEVQAINGGSVVDPTVVGISRGLQIMLSEIDDLTLKGQRLKSFVIDHYSWHVIVTDMVDYFEDLARDN